MATIESLSFPAEIPFGQEVIAEFFKDGKPVDYRMVVVIDCVYTLEASIVIEDKDGEEVMGLGGTVSRDQIKEVRDLWDMERATEAWRRFCVKYTPTDEDVDKFREWWTSKGEV